MAAENGNTVIFGHTVSDLQTSVAISSDNKITGTLKFVDSGALAHDWGEGNFLALKFTDIPDSAVSVLIGLVPSEGSGFMELIKDPDKNAVMKITDKDKQVFQVITTNGTDYNTQTFDLSGLTCETE